MAYLTGFEPRFEEALLLLVGDRPLVLITGPENHSYARISPIELELVVFPPFGLLVSFPRLPACFVRSAVLWGLAAVVLFEGGCRGLRSVTTGDASLEPALCESGESPRPR